MKKWESFYPYVLPDVPGCPDPIVDQALVLATREFCERTLIWQVDPDADTTIADVAEYDFDTDQHQEVIEFVSATLNGKPLAIVAENDLPADWKTSQQGLCECAFTLDRVRFTIVPTPTAAYDLTTKLIVRPSLSAPGVDDRIFDQYARQIGFGAKANLMMANNRPYSNMPLAAVNRGLFEDAIHRAALTHSRGHAKRRRRVSALNY